jgi:hypothetical protein
MTSACSCDAPARFRAPCRPGSRLLVAAILLVASDCSERPDPRPATPRIEFDPTPYTPWHSREEESPFPQGDWYWRELLAVAPAPEPIPSDAEADARSRAAFERVALLDVLPSEEEIPALVVDARADPRALFAALDDPRRPVRFAAARVLLRLSIGDARGRASFPRRIVEQAARHLRDDADEVALLHLETIARAGYAWTEPILLKTFGKFDNHRLTVLRIRAAALLAKSGRLGGIQVLIKALKEQTSIQDDVNREWEESYQTAWWKEEAIGAIAVLAGTDFGHSPDASDEEQVTTVRSIERWWDEHRIELWECAPPIEDPVLIERVKLLILGLGTFQLRNVDNARFLLTGMGPRVAPWLLEALDASSFLVRLHALEILADLIPLVPAVERERWIAAVTPRLSDADAAIRVAALGVLGAARAGSAIQTLDRALRGEDPEMSEAAARLLGTSGLPEARSVLASFASELAPEHPLTIPLQAARLSSGDIEPLTGFLELLRSDTDAGRRARACLSWVVERDSLSEATSAAERAAEIARIESVIRARAAASTGSLR